MTDREEMLKYMAKVEVTTQQLESLAPIIAKEVEDQYGQKLRRASSAQERENLRRYFTIKVGRENIWKQTYLSDRDLYIRLATMHGIAALVEEAETTPEPF